MAIGFDFSEYYKSMTAKTELPLDYSGVDLDQATEMAKIVTDNVLYCVAKIFADGTEYSGDYRLMVAARDGDGSARSYYARQWHSVDDIVSSGAAVDWEPGYERVGVMELAEATPDGEFTYFILNDTRVDSDGNSLPTEVIPAYRVSLAVFPRYEAITGEPGMVLPDRYAGADQAGTDLGWSGSVDQNVVGKIPWGSTGKKDYSLPGDSLPVFMRCMYGILGLYGSDKAKSVDWIFGKRNGMSDTSASAVLEEARFRKWIKRLTDECADAGIGVKVDLYDQAYARELTVEDATRDDYSRNKAAAAAKHAAYRRELAASDWTSTGMTRRTSFADAYGKYLGEFIGKFGQGSAGAADYIPLMSARDGGTQNAVVPSMRDVFKAWYYSAAELEEEFNDNIRTILDTMSNVPLGWEVIGSESRDAFNAMVGKYREIPTNITVSENTVPAYSRVAFDLSYILNEANMIGYEFDAKPVGGQDYHFVLFPRLVTRGMREIDGCDPALYTEKRCWCSVDFTTSHFGVNPDNEQTYTYCTDPVQAFIPHDDKRNIKDNNQWSTNSTYLYSAINPTEDRQVEPLNHQRVRAASEGVDGATVAEILTGYFNYFLSKNTYYSDEGITVTYADYLSCVDDATGTVNIPQGQPGATKRDNALCRYRLFMCWNACMMNYVAFECKYDTDKVTGMWMVMQAMLQGGISKFGAIVDYLVALEAQGSYRYQPVFGRHYGPDGKYDTVTYDLITWADESSEDHIVDRPRPLYEERWKVPSDGYESVGVLVDSMDMLYDAYRTMLRKLPLSAGSHGMRSVLSTLGTLGGISDDFRDLMRTVYRIRVYQMFAQESVFANKSVVGIGGLKKSFKDAPDSTGEDPLVQYSRMTPMWSMPARLMIPVNAYRRVRMKYKRWGRTRHRTVKVPIGVRWAEVQFIDNNVYEAYPQVSDRPGNDIQVGQDATVSVADRYTYRFREPLPQEVVDAGTGSIYTGTSGDGAITGLYPNATVVDEHTMECDSGPAGDSCYVTRVRIPLPPAQRDDTKYAITVRYDMPHIPYDSEIRRKAFSDYGPLSQDRRFPVTETGDGGYGIIGETRRDGWRYFMPTSSSLRDLRCGVASYDDFMYYPARPEASTHTVTEIVGSQGICEKAAMLLRILEDEFGKDRVQLIETTRSMDDQAKVCLGGPESAFLSWHNYGLAVKIMVYQPDLTTPAELYGDEYKRMIPIARAFTEACATGKIGKPCNVVWCRRLLVGPSLFDWEFLPVGVGHKDAPLFREDVLNQMDPVAERSYVDVDTAGYVKNWSRRDDSYSLPYILKSSPAYVKSTVVGGRHYVPTSSIRNFRHVDDIVLYDAKEYVDLVKLKMDAYGTDRVTGTDMATWRSGNPVSCAQLIRYFGMTGNISGAKSLIAGSYADRYNCINSMYYSADPVKYVREMLGDKYQSATIVVDKDGDSSYITLSDGRLHVRAEDAYPDMPSSSADVHKSRQATPDRMKHGNWVGGRFYTYDEMPIRETVSDGPVIAGYSLVEGSYYPVSGDALLLHSMIATQIHKEYEAIQGMFADYSGPLMYDRFDDSPNYEMADMLENEFGLIKAQDLISFDDMEDALNAGSIPDVPGLPSGSVYEKVVNNAEVAGMRRAVSTREHVHVNDRHPGVSMEELYRRLVERGYMANDLLRK